MKKALEQIINVLPAHSYWLIRSKSFKGHSPVKNQDFQKKQTEINDLLSNYENQAQEKLKEIISTHIKNSGLFNYILTVVNDGYSSQLASVLEVSKGLLKGKLFEVFNQKNDNGMTLLMRAVAKNNGETLKILLKFGAETYVKNKDDKFACFYANDIQIKKLVCPKTLFDILSGMNAGRFLALRS